ncbi:SapC family protein [Aquisediminimonas profunda]|uniref:SapC family protein n=1 Tax=Aquisediminimonas profunda TaxID=1550733 RepID=UPI001C62BEE0|nr:SapC family protein [Aquisediminimonas profunda]
MASVPPANNQLPLLFSDLTPLSSVEHASWKARASDALPVFARQHAIPLTIDEFAVAQRYYPIIFSAGDNPVPLALMGLNEGINTFVDADGKLLDQVYVPAYVRRYPFLLARLREDSDELSLCFDPSANTIGPFEEGDPLFVDGQPSEGVKAILGFCEQFEQAGQRTTAFMQELIKSELLMDGEVSIQVADNEQPFVYRGFQMVNEEKLRDLRGDSLRKMMQSGLLPLVHAHLFSLGIMREIFARQLDQGKVPAPEIAA